MAMNRLQWTGHPPFCLGLQIRFMPTHKERRGDNRNRANEKQSCRQRNARLQQGFAERVGAQAKDGSPQDAARSIGEEEMPPIHAVHPGEESGHYSEQGDEATEEHDLAAVPRE